MVLLWDASDREYRILSLLASHENDKTGRCNPSYATLAEEGNIERANVRRVIRSLERKGKISVKRAKNTPTEHNANQYTFLFPKVEGSHSKNDDIEVGDDLSFPDDIL